MEKRNNVCFYVLGWTNNSLSFYTGCQYWNAIFVIFALLIHQNAKALKAKKEEGNQAFKNNNYEAAYQLYTEALMIDPNNIKTNAKLYCNRATAGAKVKE